MGYALSKAVLFLAVPKEIPNINLVFLFSVPITSKFHLFISITWRILLAQSPAPEAHDKVLHSNPDQIGILKC